MRRHRRERRWTDHATTALIFATVAAIAATMALAANDDFLEENVPTPEFLPDKVNITVREGDAAILPCSVRHLGTKQVVWRRLEGDRILTIGTMTWSVDNNVSMDHSKKPGHVTTWNLMLHHVTPEDAGVYECQVTSRAGHVHHVKLNVVGPPIPKQDSSHLSGHLRHGQGANIPNHPVSVCGTAGTDGCTISITGKRYVDQGERIHLVCNASGGPRVPEEIDWFKGGDKIDSVKYGHVHIGKFQSMADRSFISELTIQHSSLTDTGDYICRSSTEDIANLKVTVLHAESANKRRGTNPGAHGLEKGPGGPENGDTRTRCSSVLLPTLLLSLWTLHVGHFDLFS